MNEPINFMQKSKKSEIVISQNFATCLANQLSEYSIGKIVLDNEKLKSLTSISLDTSVI